MSHSQEQVQCPNCDEISTTEEVHSFTAAHKDWCEVDAKDWFEQGASAAAWTVCQYTGFYDKEGNSLYDQEVEKRLADKEEYNEFLQSRAVCPKCEAISNIEDCEPLEDLQK
jgi:hypothetical protein